MGIAALYHTRAPHPAHRIYPYRLRRRVIDWQNPVWATDLTYMPMRRRVVYLAARIDWAARKVLAHRVSITMTSDFCIEVLEEVIAK